MSGFHEFIASLVSDSNISIKQIAAEKDHTSSAADLRAHLILLNLCGSAINLPLCESRLPNLERFPRFGRIRGRYGGLLHPGAALGRQTRDDERSARPQIGRLHRCSVQLWHALIKALFKSTRISAPIRQIHPTCLKRPSNIVSFMTLTPSASASKTITCACKSVGKAG